LKVWFKGFAKENLKRGCNYITVKQP